MMKAQDRYAVIGYPIAHSRSPEIHAMFARQTGQTLSYERLEVPPGELEKAVRRFAGEGGRGLNVTVPHKEAIVDLLDRVTPRAAAAGAVNTVAFGAEGALGDNTDGAGLLRDLVGNLGTNPAGLRVLVLGAGGAAGGVLGPLLEAGARVTIANRHRARGETLAARQASAAVRACGYEEAANDGPYALILNATSAGLRGEAPPCPAAAVSADTLCYDLSYADRPTPFCAWAISRGARRAVMGWGMLVEQAALAFELWRGILPQTGPVLAALAPRQDG